MQTVEGSDEQPGDEQDDETESGLQGDESPHPAGSRAWVIATLERLDRPDGGGSQRRREAEEQTHAESQDDGECEHAPVHGKGEAGRVVGRIDSCEYQRRGPLREAPAEGGGKQSDGCSFNQDQSPESPSSCADGDTERHFTGPGRCLRGHQVRYVRTGNQQHQHDEYA